MIDTVLQISPTNLNSANLDLSTKVVVGLASTLIAGFTYFQTYKKSRFEWERCFTELHKDFWEDSDFAIVRKWLINEECYAKIKPILQKRMEIGIASNQGRQTNIKISKEEYDHIDLLDKYLNFLTRFIYLVPVTKQQVKIMENFFFGFWLGKVSDAPKIEIQWYVQEFYKPLVQANLELKLSEFKKFQNRF